MAALLRQGARRLGGSVVQRTRAAFTTPAAAGERRLLTTPAAAEERRLLSTEHARPEPPKDPKACLREIQARKEKLYDFLSLMECSSMPKTYQNRALLRFLSAQIRPRPEDDQWCELRRLKKSQDSAEATILVCTFILGYQYWSFSGGRKEGAQTAEKQEQ